MNDFVNPGLTKTSLLSAPSTVSMFVPAPEDFSDEQPTNMADRWIYLMCMDVCLFVAINIIFFHVLFYDSLWLSNKLLSNKYFLKIISYFFLHFCDISVRVHSEYQSVYSSNITC